MPYIAMLYICLTDCLQLTDLTSLTMYVNLRCHLPIPVIAGVGMADGLPIDEACKRMLQCARELDEASEKQHERKVSARDSLELLRPRLATDRHGDAVLPCLPQPSRKVSVKSLRRLSKRSPAKNDTRSRPNANANATPVTRANPARANDAMPFGFIASGMRPTVQDAK
jgi:hypothetical protein